jgi:chemotaxis protein CheX
MKIIVAGTSPSIANSVRNIFTEAKIPALEVVGTKEVEDTVAALADKCLVLIDWEYADEKIPVAIVAAVKAKLPATPVIILCVKQKAGGTFAAMKAGANGVVNKPVDPKDLLRATASAFKSITPAQGQARPSVNVEFINPFIDSTRNVFATMCGIEITRKKLFLKEDHKMLGEVSGVMGLSGSASGSVVVSFSGKLACTIVGKMLQTEMTELNEDVCDGVGEVINMISGQAKSVLAKTKYHFNISIPSVVSGLGHEISHKKGTPNIVVLFDANGEEFALQVCLATTEQ